MRTRRRQVKPEKKSSFKARLINQSIFCVVLIISVMCVNSVNKTNTNVLIKNIRDSLYTSIDYKKTADSIKDIFTRLLNERKNNNDEKNEQKPTTTDNSGEQSGDTSFNNSFILHSNRT